MGCCCSSSKDLDLHEIKPPIKKPEDFLPPNDEDHQKKTEAQIDKSPDDQNKPDAPLIHNPENAPEAQLSKGIF